MDFVKKNKKYGAIIGVTVLVAIVVVVLVFKVFTKSKMTSIPSITNYAQNLNLTTNTTLIKSSINPMLINTPRNQTVRIYYDADYGSEIGNKIKSLSMTSKFPTTQFVVGTKSGQDAISFLSDLPPEIQQYPIVAKSIDMPNMLPAFYKGNGMLQDIMQWCAKPYGTESSKETIFLAIK